MENKNKTEKNAYMQLISNGALVNECDTPCWKGFLRFALGDVAELLCVVLHNK